MFNGQRLNSVELKLVTGLCMYMVVLANANAANINHLDIGDGVYVQGLFSDEMVYVVRIDKSDNTVKVRRASDGTTHWVYANHIIYRNQAIANDIGRAAITVGIVYCLMVPEDCKQ